MHLSQIDNAQAENIWKKIRRYLPLVLVIIAMCLLARDISVEALKGFLEKNEALGLILCFLAYLVLGISFIPPDAMTLMVLGLKGPVAAFCIKILGDTLLAMVEFYFGAGVGDLADFEKTKARLPFHLDRLPIDSPAFLIFARFLPWFGPKMVSIAGGAYRVPAHTFLWTTFVANLLGALLTVTGGYGLFQLLQKIPGAPALFGIVQNSTVELWAGPRLEIIRITSSDLRTSEIAWRL